VTLNGHVVDVLNFIFQPVGSRKAKGQLSWRRPSGRPRNVWLNNVQIDANAIPLSIRYGALRSPWVTERSNGPLRLRWW